MIQRLFGGRRRAPGARGQASVLGDLFGRCPVCGDRLAGHEYWRLAAAIVHPPSERAQQLADLVARRQWRDAADIANWEHDKDVREYYVIRCPKGGRLGLVTVTFTADFWSEDVVEGAVALSDEDSEVVRSIAGDRWAPF